MSSKITTNIRFLRDYKKMTQEEFGAYIGGLTRGQIASYEDGRSEPKLITVINLAKVFGLTLDLLLTGKVTTRHLEAAAKGHQPLNLPGPMGIPLISQAAYTPYLQGAADKHFLEQQPMLFIPGLQQGPLYRAFEVRSDNMHPTLQPGDWLVCRKVAKGEGLDFAQVYLLVSSSEEILVHRILALPAQDTLELVSDNPASPRIAYPQSAVKELWMVNFRLTKSLSGDVTLGKLEAIEKQLLHLTKIVEDTVF
jgi:transcriptional regulator with XRE-family HTH domain